MSERISSVSGLVSPLTRTNWHLSKIPSGAPCQNDKETNVKHQLGKENKKKQWLFVSGHVEQKHITGWLQTAFSISMENIIDKQTKVEDNLGQIIPCSTCDLHR